MRVLYLANAGHIGGGNRSLQMLWDAGSHLGIEPIAVCPTEGPMVIACREQGVHVRVLRYHQPSWRTPLDTCCAYWEWRHLLKEVMPAVIHANDFSNARSIALAAWSLGIPVVCHIQFHQPADAIRWTFRRLPRPAAFIHNSRATSDVCGPVLDSVCPRSRQVIIHNCVPLGSFQRQRGAMAQSRPARVGIVGNLIPIKGHEDFLGMAAILAARKVDAEYWIIGDDIHQCGHGVHLRQVCARLALEEKVSFLGFRGDVSCLLNELDVLVVASHVEPFGIVSLEGMACELPVVGTRVGGIPEVIDDGVTGFVVSPHSPTELAEKVGVLLADRKLCRRMGEKGRERVQSFFSSENHATRVVELYSDVLAG
jgi:glycosyltransferase involved in cell wall biosynthesis